MHCKMSFNDIAAPRDETQPIRRSSNALTTLSEELKELQSGFVRLKDSVSKIQRTTISSSMKASVDEELRRLRGMETRLKNQTDIQQKQLESLPRAEVAQRRVALGKLTKDFERIKLGLNQLTQDVNRLRVDDAIAEANGTSGLSTGGLKFAGAAPSGGRASSGRGNSVFRMDGRDGSRDDSRDNNSRGGVQAQGIQFQQVIKGEQIDDLLAEEREKEILKMNQDLKMVNEMFKDMAEIVQDQNGMIQQVAETTENANSRAKEGLKQVEQAAGYQSSCNIS